MARFPPTGCSVTLTSGYGARRLGAPRPAPGRARGRDGVGSRLHEDAPHPRRPLRRPARLRLRPALRRGRRRRGRHAAGALPARGRPLGARRAAHARRALLVVPLPQDDPGPHRGRAADRGARPGRLRALGQAGRARPTTRSPATSSGCASCSSTGSTCATSRWCARTGAGSSACAWSASTPTASPASWPPTRSCPRATPTPGRPSSPGSSSPRRSRSSRPAASSGAGAPSPSPPEVEAAYDAPFPDESYKAGARQFPMLVPSRPDDPAHDANVAAWVGLAAFDRPFLCAFSDGDPITKGADRNLKERIAGRRGSPTRRSSAAGTSSRRTAGRSWPRSSSPSSPPPRDLASTASSSSAPGSPASGWRPASAPWASTTSSSSTAATTSAAPGGTTRTRVPPATSRPTSTRSPSPSIPDWSRSFPSQSEIWDYMRGCVDRFDVGGHLRFGRAVDEARWDEAAARWVVRTTGGEEYVAPVLVWATGSLSEPSIPDFPGLADFRGKVFHSARWEHGFDLTGQAGLRRRHRGLGRSSSCPRSPRSSSTSTCTSGRRPSSSRAATGRSRGLRKLAYRKVPALQRLSRLRIYAIFESLLVRLRRPRRAAQGRRPQGRPRPPRQAGARRGPAREADAALRARLQAPAALRRLLPLAHPAQRRGRGVARRLVHRARGGGAGRHRPPGRRGDHGHRLRGRRAPLRRAHRRQGRRPARRGLEGERRRGVRRLHRGRLPQPVPDDRAQLDAGPQLHDLHDRVAHQLHRQRAGLHGPSRRARRSRSSPRCSGATTSACRPGWSTRSGSRGDAAAGTSTTGAATRRCGRTTPGSSAG